MSTVSSPPESGKPISPEYIVISGDPIEGGLVFWGPFPDCNAAAEWAECNGKADLTDETWWVTTLESPIPDDELSEAEEGAQ